MNWTRSSLCKTDHVTGNCLEDAVRAEGYGFVIDPKPWEHPWALGNPDPSHTAVLCHDGTGKGIICVSDSWDHAYAAAHEIAEDRRGHTHTAEVFCEQANLLAKWCRALAGREET